MHACVCVRIVREVNCNGVRLPTQAASNNKNNNKNKNKNKNKNNNNNNNKYSTGAPHMCELLDHF